VIRALGLGLVILAAAGLSACDFNSYCIDCPRDGGGDDGDGGNGDGGGIIDSGDLPDACIPTGIEVCNGLDEDCDGTTDEDSTSVGDPCGTDVGNCTEGLIECNAGELECSGVAAAPEECDDADNDCDGNTDEGNPEGGQMCGSDVGECIGGFTQCIAGGTIDCVGDSGTPGMNPETCNGLDDDCDAEFDEDVATMGDCGFTDVGECEPGVLTCVGGGPQCVGGTGPAFEECDTTGLDSDCDGDPNNGYDLQNDVRNCNGCGISCIGTITNATEKCEMGMCAIASCDPGFHDDITIAGQDCLYPCEFQGPFEACNDADDDCDGIVDENVAAPGICDQDGECAGTLASCEAGVFVCDYPTTVPVDVDGNIEPESTCDTLDNDCDGDVDESHPDVGADCTGGTDVGICQDTGQRECDPGDAEAPTICVLDDFGDPAEASETCDFEDDDCDGAVDEGASTGAIQEWVTIGGTVADPTQIMKYEASRPDARSNVEGIEEGYVCSRPGVEPWTGLTQPDAEAECLAIGARLCTEQEWHRACSVVTGVGYPLTGPGASPEAVYIEAEDYETLVTATAGTTLRTWVPDYTAGYSGISALRSSPDNNTPTDISAANALTQSPRLTYRLDIQAPVAAHYVWVKMYSANNAADRIHVGMSGTTTALQSIDTGTNGAWVWIRHGPFANVTAGVQTVTLYMREDGAKVDAIVVTRNSSSTAPTTTTPNGGDWSFQTSPDVYVGTTCNGIDNGAGVILDTGAETQCNAAWPAGNGGGVFDMSGNVKEWTAERLPDANPIRGGAYNNLPQGISCSLSFTLAADDFFFDNVGFRCCR
jgi:hypothetical protein